MNRLLKPLITFLNVVAVLLETKEIADPNQKLSPVDRLVKIVVHSGLKGSEPNRPIIERRDDHHRYRSIPVVPLDSGRQLKTADSWHHSVRQDQIRVTRLHLVERILRRTRGQHCIGFRLQKRGDEAATASLIIHDQNHGKTIRHRKDLFRREERRLSEGDVHVRPVSGCIHRNRRR